MLMAKAYDMYLGMIVNRLDIPHGIESLRYFEKVNLLYNKYIDASPKQVSFFVVTHLFGWRRLKKVAWSLGTTVF